MKEIKLDKNLVTKVDDENYEYLNQWEWYALWNGNSYYAVRNSKPKERSDRKRKTIRMHNIILPHKKGFLVDHKDLDGLNNLHENLRYATYSQNGLNRRKHGKSKYIGVSYDKNGYIRATITVKGKQLALGYFKTEEDAARAFDDAAKFYRNEFITLNFV